MKACSAGGVWGYALSYLSPPHLLPTSPPPTSPPPHLTPWPLCDFKRPQCHFFKGGGWEGAWHTYQIKTQWQQVLLVSVCWVTGIVPTDTCDFATLQSGVGGGAMIANSTGISMSSKWDCPNWHSWLCHLSEWSGRWSTMVNTWSWVIVLSQWLDLNILSTTHSHLRRIKLCHKRTHISNAHVKST